MTHTVIYPSTMMIHLYRFKYETYFENTDITFSAVMCPYRLPSFFAAAFLTVLIDWNVINKKRSL
jgi:hypothetical protein